MIENPIRYEEIKVYFIAKNYRGEEVKSSISLTAMPKTLDEIEECCEYFGYGEIKVTKLVKVQIKTELTIIEEYELPARETVNP